MDRLGGEIWQAARRLVRTPAFTVATVLTLALAIGANAAIFAVVQRVVLNPLPYADSDRLIALDHGALGLNMPTGIVMAPGLYYQYLDRARTLEGVALYRSEDVTVSGSVAPERIRIARATPSLAAVLRVSPAEGRWFSEEEGAPGGAPVAVLSHGLWMRRFGGNPAIVGQTIRVNGAAAEVIGVMPAAYAFPDPRVDMWTPEPLSRAAGFGFFQSSGVARVREGVAIESVKAELDGIIANLPQVYPNYLTGIGRNLQLMARPVTLKEATVGRVARALWILLASVALVLLVACANVANLFLVRSEARQRDLAIRRALGAGGMGIVRHFLIESTLLSIAGGLAGLAIAQGAVQLLAAYGPRDLPRLAELRLDVVALGFTLLLTLLVALVFGAMPLMRRATLAGTLHELGRGNTTSRSRHHARRLLMGGQIALALVLLASSALMVRSFQALRAMDPGFNAESTLTFRLGLQGPKYPDRRTIVQTHSAILDRIAALPGVAGASASTCLPLAEEGLCYGNALFVDGRPMPRGALPPSVAFRGVAGGYLETMGIRLLRGRAIDRGDVERGEPVVVVSDALVKLYFPDQDPIGQRIASSSRTRVWLTIVGVAANTPVTALAEAKPTPILYMPMSIAGGPDIPVPLMAGPDVTVVSYVVRTSSAPEGLVSAVRGAVSGADAELAIAQVRTLQEVLDRASAQMAFTMALLTIAAALALTLSIIGIYGVISYIVSQRTGEIGVRLALGAEPRDVARMVLRQGALVAIAGIIVGLGAALASSQMLESQLYGVSAREPLVLAATSVTLLAVALLGCWLPARRAARVSPVEALRTSL